MKRFLTSLLFIYAFTANADFYDKNQNMEEGWALLLGTPMAVSQAPLLPEGIILTSIQKVEDYPSVILSTYKECSKPKEYDFYKAKIGSTWVNMIAVCTHDNRVKIGARTQKGADFIVQQLVKSKDPIVLELEASYSTVEISIPATNFKQALEYFEQRELNAL
ncbi:MULTISPECIES: hypothetical protein [Vibrio harveyi group]|uniref:Uncharacterized protein n=1 Tax=Vibrio mytili TaxID=50718 RepID=A0A0C3I4J9_9VIBR|nr:MULTISPECIES: hypothetical protein [Vibrio harveyi group]KIN09262.1 hypothetical protein SU60_20345 [Vibrio mytili]MBE4308539.1 hypothetical protein [Vibrio parahaemolyticus]MBS9925335.1 hypothetical protein [Vibrio alginolyticus]MQC32940.1 hypothetical protein [Vibrio parahaemolyticus]